MGFRSRMTSTIVALSLILALYAEGLGQKTVDSSKNDRGIEEFLARWNEAIASKDYVTIRRSYVSDVRFKWFEDGKLRYASVDEILTVLNTFPKDATISTKLGSPDVSSLSDRLAFVSATFKTKIAIQSGSIELDGVFTAILRTGSDSAICRFETGSTAIVSATRL